MPEDQDDEGFTREELIEDGLLLTEYQQINEEFRHRNQLIHNTFYLLIIAGGVFGGLSARFLSLSNLVLSGLIVSFGGLTSSIIGHLFLKHFHDRSSAEVARMHAEWIANKTKEKSKRALSVNWGVGGGGVIHEGERVLTRRGSYIHYLRKWPDSLVSAETAGLTLVYFGAVTIPAGIGIVIFSVTPRNYALITGLFGFSAALAGILGIYHYMVKTSQPPEEDPIY